MGGYIVDLTATQFGYKKPVQVVTRPSEWHKPFRSSGRKAVREVMEWNGYQNPITCLSTLRRAAQRVIRSAA